MTRYQIQCRKFVEVCTDPQRRCYNGCFASSEMRWTEWEEVYTTSSKDDADSSVRIFSDINPSHEYRIKEIHES